ncbi:flagellar protein FliT [Scandinavium sp. NPDC088450]|uniref:flagellar protein FliT n=1 Tax=Scandinavium sp. NPDC088450 TaxID=3364514 RepID=UPI003850F1AE
MDNTIIAQIDALIARNSVLLSYAEQQEWEAFTNEVEDYSRVLNEIGQVNFSLLEQAVKEAAVERLEILLGVDATLMQCIQARLHSLSTEMSSLRKSRASANAYTAV